MKTPVASPASSPVPARPQMSGRLAQRHGRYSTRSRELRALGRLQNRVADLAKAQMAVMNARAHGDAHCVEVAEERVAACAQQVRRAVLSLDRVLVERGDEEGRRRLVEGALRLIENA